MKMSKSESGDHFPGPNASNGATADIFRFCQKCCPKSVPDRVPDCVFSWENIKLSGLDPSRKIRSEILCKTPVRMLRDLLWRPIWWIIWFSVAFIRTVYLLFIRTIYLPCIRTQYFPLGLCGRHRMPCSKTRITFAGRGRGEFPPSSLNPENLIFEL